MKRFTQVLHEAGVFEILMDLLNYYLLLEFHWPDADWKKNKSPNELNIIRFEEAKTVLVIYLGGCLVSIVLSVLEWFVHSKSNFVFYKIQCFVHQSIFLTQDLFQQLMLFFLSFMRNKRFVVSRN